jgi:protein SCO1/2
MRDVVIKSCIAIILLVGFVACGEVVETPGQGETKATTLPFFGQKEYIEGIDKDTIYHSIPFWNFINQDSLYVSKSNFDGKPYVAYFFFSTCPGICPAMTGNMAYFQQQTQGLDINIIAHTVDPMADSVVRLKEYSEIYDIDSANFHFITGLKHEIYELGVKGYMVPSQEDALAPGGFLHSEQLILVDKDAHIRGYYDGTDQDAVELLIKDINKLIKDESRTK